MRTESTPGARGPVFCGVDTHADSHWLCVLDWRGRKVLSRQFPADAAGYEALVSVNIIFTIFANAFSPIAPTRIRRIRQRGCAAFGV